MTREQNDVIIDYRARFFEEQEKNRQLEEQIKMLKQLGFKEKYTYASTLARINKRLESISRKNKLGCDYYDELVVGSKVFEYTDEIFEVSKKCFEIINL